MMLHESFVSYFQSLAKEILKPPSTLNFYEWAPKNIKTSDGAGFRFYPYQVQPAIDLFSADIAEITLRWASGMGKTYLIGAGFAYALAHLRLQTSVMFPSQQVSEDWCRDELFPFALDRCESLRQIPYATDLVRKKVWVTGASLQLAGANSFTAIRRIQSSFMYSDEIDAITQEASDEGDKLKMHEARGRGRKVQRKIRSSYPSLLGHSKIDSLYDESDACRWLSECINCGKSFEMHPDQIRYPKGDTSKAELECPECASMLTDTDRRIMTVEASQWIDRDGNPINPTPQGFRGHRGYHLNCMAFAGPHNESRRSYLHEIAEEKEAVKRAPDVERASRVFLNTKCCESYRPKDVPKPDADQLYKQLEPYDATKELPEGVLGIWAGTDIQKRWIDLSMWGFGLNDESWLLERIQINGSFLSDKTWEKWLKELRKDYNHPLYGKMSAIKPGCRVNAYVDGNHWFGDCGGR